MQSPLKSLALAAGLAVVAAFSSITPATAGTVKYHYDALGRVVRADFPNGMSILYLYDAAGNRTEVLVNVTPP